jgi:hypothetical protein
VSGSVGFSDKFSNRFHIGKVQRKPLRQEVSDLRARAKRLPQTEEMRGLMTQLDSARDIIYGKVKTNEARQDSVDKTNAILKVVKPKLKDIEEQAPEVTGFQVSGRKASKEDEARAKDLLQKVELLKNDVTALFQQSGTNVLMPQNLGRMDLLGQVEQVKLHVGQTIVTSKRATVLQNELDLAREALDHAREYVEESRSELEEYETDIEAGRAMLTQLTSLKLGKVTETPLSQKLEALNRAVHPESNLINPDGIEKLAREVTAEMILAKKDPAAYMRGSSVGSKKEKDIATSLAAFNSAVGQRLEELRLRSEALGGEDHLAPMAAADKARITISKPTGAVPDGAQTAQPILTLIDTANKALVTKTNTLRKSVQDMYAEVEKAIAGVKDTQSVKVYAADWRGIDGLLNTVGGLLPPKTGTLDAGMMERLGTVAPLVKTLEAQAKALASDKATVGDFDGNLAALKKDFATSGGSDALPTHFPKEWKDMQEALAKLEKNVGVAKAKDSAAALKKLQTDFDTKAKAAEDLANYIATDIKPDQDRHWNIYVVAQLSESDIPMPNTQGLALNALATELEKTPPDKAKLGTLKAALDKAFENISSPQDLTQAALASHSEEKTKAKTAKQLTGNLQKPLKDRLYALKMQFEEAEAAVKTAKGDQNQLDQIDRMMEKAKAEIDAVTSSKPDTKAAETTLDRIQRHLDLVLAHPEGEVNRHRGELPGLYDEYRKIRSEASEQLKALDGMIAQYVAPDDDTKSKVAKLRKQFEAYRTAFAKGHNNFAPFIGALTDDERPDGERRKAREAGLAAIAELERGLMSHPLTRLLAESPMPGVKGVPRRLLGALDRLNFTILTCVE